MEVQQEFDDIMDASLDDLVSRHSTRSVAPAVAASWNLPTSGIVALRKTGIAFYEPQADTVSVQLRGDIQGGHDPILQVERMSAYRLGFYWRRTIGAAVGSGIVVAIPNDPSLQMGYINSSIDAFVEISWRWGCIRKVLLKCHGAEQLFANLATFQEYVHSVDRAIHDDPMYRWWNGIVEGW